VALLSSVGGPTGCHEDVSRVEARGEATDGATFARGVKALEENDERGTGCGRLEKPCREKSQLRQTMLRLGDALVGFLLGIVLVRSISSTG